MKRIVMLGLLVASCGGLEATDPHACGSPSYDCLGGACVDGTCHSLLVAPATDPFTIAIDDTRIYWADLYATEIDWAMKDGSAHGVLAAVPSCAAPQLAADATFVYDACGGQLLEITKDGAVSTLLDHGAVAVTVATSGAVFVAADGVIEQWPASPVFNFTADAHGVYWSDFDSFPPLFATSACGNAPGSISDVIDGTPSSAGLGRPPPFGMMSNGDVLVWTDQCERSVNVLDHGKTTTITSGLGEVPKTSAVWTWPKAALTSSLAADQRAAYVFATTTDWVRLALVRVSLAGGAQQTLETGIIEPTNIAIDDDALYFGSRSPNGGIFRIAKPR